MWFKRTREPQEAPPVIRDEELIAGYFKDPLFKRRIVEVAEHTQAKQLEGGFALYRNKMGRLIISKAILPDPSWWLYTHGIQGLSEQEKEERHPSRSFPAHMLTHHYEPGIRPMNAEQDGYWRQDRGAYRGMRKDVIFHLHSHPRMRLVPSIPDIRHWSAVEAHNPFMVDSILVSGDSLTKLLLWRRAEGSQYQPPAVYSENGWDLVEEDYYQTLYERLHKRSTEDFQRFAQGVGINALTVSYNRDRNRFYPNASQIAEVLTG